MPANMPLRFACCDKHLPEAMAFVTRARAEEGLVLVHPMASPDSSRTCIKDCTETATWFVKRVEGQRDRKIVDYYLNEPAKAYENSNHVIPPHDYEPGTFNHPMHTDPLCKPCGLPKKDIIHESPNP